MHRGGSLDVSVSISIQRNSPHHFPRIQPVAIPEQETHFGDLLPKGIWSDCYTTAYNTDLDVASTGPATPLRQTTGIQFAQNRRAGHALISSHSSVHAQGTSEEEQCHEQTGKRSYAKEQDGTVSGMGDGGLAAPRPRKRKCLEAKKFG
jgi:hypothetical protein